MPVESQIICDGCSGVLRGRVKGRMLHHDYLSFKDAQATLQLMDTRTGYKEYIWLTQQSDNPYQKGQWLNFCLKPGIPCLDTFIDRQRGKYMFHKQQKLRARAEEEQLRRLETG